METKREKFIRLAEARTNKIINTIQLLENLSNKNAYEYTKKDVDQMFKAIDTALAEAKQAYAKTEAKEVNKFSFKD